MDKSSPGTSNDEMPIIAEYCLMNLPTVLDLILCNLNAKDLSSASCVCWFWNQAAQRLWSKRLQIVTKLMYMADGEQINEVRSDCTVKKTASTAIPTAIPVLSYFEGKKEIITIT